MIFRDSIGPTGLQVRLRERENGKQDVLALDRVTDCSPQFSQNLPDSLQEMFCFML
jgi:hypothetical protein